MANELEIRTAKIADASFVDRWLTLARDVGAQSVSFRIQNEQICAVNTLEDVENATGFADVRRLADVGAANLSGTIGAAHHSIQYIRSPTFDQIKLTIPGAQQRNFEATATITQALNRHFPSIDLNASLMDLFDADLKRYYTQREAGLVRLEQLSEKLIQDNIAYRQRVDAELQDHRQALDRQFNERVQTLDQRKEALDEREREMDLSDAKSARRRMRDEIIKKLQPDTPIELTLKKSWSVHAVFGLLSVIFGGTSLYLLTRTDFEFLNLTHSLKLGVALAGLVGTLTVYFRWKDAWLRRGIDEQLRLRQLGIDVDRSTWVVEMLSELKDAAGEIPEEVLSALTRNLFTGVEPSQAVRHPSEELLAQLLRTSRSLELNFPGGSLKTDGKALQKASKDAATDP